MTLVDYLVWRQEMSADQGKQVQVLHLTLLNMNLSTKS